MTRNSRALDPQSRTLRTEIDLPNPRGRLLPGMYVQATILIEHLNVWSLPLGAVATEGEHIFCIRVVNGKAVRTPLQLGLRGGDLVEVLKQQVRAAAPGEPASWEDITGEEEVVAGNPAALQDGQPVRPASASR